MRSGKRKLECDSFLVGLAQGSGMNFNKWYQGVTFLMGCRGPKLTAVRRREQCDMNERKSKETES